jgi:hypothetical protein
VGRNTSENMQHSNKDISSASMEVRLWAAPAIEFNFSLHSKAMLYF